MFKLNLVLNLNMATAATDLTNWTLLFVSSLNNSFFYNLVIVHSYIKTQNFGIIGPLS